MRDTRPVTNAIPFVLYQLPRGTAYLINFDLHTPQSLAKASLIKAAGFWFEIERLSTGELSATITDDNGDYSFAVGPDGPGLEDRINEMIMGFDIEEAKLQSEEHEATNDPVSP